MAAIDQSTTRTALADLLQSALVGSGKPTQQVYDGLIGDFGSKAPVVMVTDAGVKRKPRELTGTRYRNYFRELVLVWVADADAAAGWTDKMAEDQLSALDKAIADVVSANRRTVNWNWIGHEDDFAIPEPVPDEGGKSYLVLPIPLLVEVFDA